MKIAIKGLTGRTLAFNTVGLILRGSESSIIDADTIEKQNEIKELENLNFIRTVNIDELEKEKAEETATIEDAIEQAVQAEEVAEETTDLEDAPSETEDINEILYGKKEETPEETPKAPRPSKNKTISDLEIPEETTTATVSLGNTTVSVPMTKVSDVKGVSDKTAESIEALEKLEKEEKEETKIDESKFEENSKMGGPATVVTAEGEDTVAMKNSIVPSAEEVKEKDPFIDKEENAEKEVLSADAEEAFIDTVNKPLIEDDNDDVGEQFIEI